MNTNNCLTKFDEKNEFSTKCFKNLIKCYHRQSYPKELIEWVIIDDGTDKIEDILNNPDTQELLKNMKIVI